MNLFPALLSPCRPSVSFCYCPQSFSPMTGSPLTPAELALKTPVVDKDADAETIFWEVHIDDSHTQQNELTLENYVRVKIFTERGKDSQSKVDIKFDDAKIRDIVGPGGKTKRGPLSCSEEGHLRANNNKDKRCKGQGKIFCAAGSRTGSPSNTVGVRFIPTAYWDVCVWNFSVKFRCARSPTI